MKQLEIVFFLLTKNIYKVYGNWKPLNKFNIIIMKVNKLFNFVLSNFFKENNLSNYTSICLWTNFGDFALLVFSIIKYSSENC